MRCCFPDKRTSTRRLTSPRKPADRQNTRDAAGELVDAERDGYRLIAPTAHCVAVERSDLQHTASVLVRTLETSRKLQEMLCPLTQQLHITCHCVERVSKFGWYRSLVAYDGQWESLLSVVLSGSSASMQGLQEQLMELAASNIVVTQRLATVEAASTVTPLPPQVLMPSVISTRVAQAPSSA